MARALRTAAIIVGAVALAATGAGALASAGLIGAGVGSTATVLGVSAGTLATVGAVASVAATALTYAANAAAPKGSLEGSATKFTINRDSGIPIVFGRCWPGGRIHCLAGGWT